MRNLAGHPQATVLAAAELQAAGIPIVAVDHERREVPAEAGGLLGSFTFRRAWVYWVVSGTMSKAHAHAINVAPRASEQASRYSGGEQTWGDVIRVSGYSGGTTVHGPVDSWHIDTEEGLAYFAERLRAFGYAEPVRLAA